VVTVATSPDFSNCVRTLATCGVANAGGLVQVGAETAVGMLDKIETKLIEAMAAINEGR